MNIKKVLIVGNRITGLDAISKLDFLEITCIAALEGSELSKLIKRENTKNKISFSSKERVNLFNFIQDNTFDILLSTGCPFILPIEKMKKKDQLFINAHPSLLPKGRGIHPINEILLKEHKYYGASLHYIDTNIDSGNIIYQKKYPLSSDLNLDLLYYLSFQCEKEVIEKGLKKLHENKFNYLGEQQIGNPSTFQRNKNIQRVDLKVNNSKEIKRIVNAFGTRSQGTYTNIGEEIFKIFDIQIIKNQHIAKKFKKNEIGSLCYTFKDKLLIKVIDAFMLITNYEIVN